MDSTEIRRRFLKFFEKKGHAIVPSSSLVPDDPSVLLTTAGMQQFKPYYTGQADALKDFQSQRTASVQKSFRTSDVEEVGDESHLTFFEMMGNFSFPPVGTDDPVDTGKAGYFKRSSIHWAYEFITQEMGLEVDYVTIFDPSYVAEGDWRKSGVAWDESSYEIWRNEVGIPEPKIKRRGVDNFWGPTGEEGPCGPTTEIYVNGLEVWNIVFNEFYCHKDKTLARLPDPGVDTGMGLERLAMVAQKVETIFHTDLFLTVVEAILGLPKRKEDIASVRIMADHLRAAAFLLADGINPSNKDRGYILRRILRRAIVKAHINLGIDLSVIKLANFVEWFIIPLYGDFYPEIDSGRDRILSEIWEEQNRFLKTLSRGYHEFQMMARKSKDTLLGKDVFYLLSTYGFPVEVTKELASQHGLTVDENGLEHAMHEHQDVSRKGAAKKFGGHGLILETGELHASSEGEQQRVTRLHTATHLLAQALRDVLDPSIQQHGSDITTKRTRFDFNFPRKLSSDEISQIEDTVNEKIKSGLEVRSVQIPKGEALKLGAQAAFREKYPDIVSVYLIGRIVGDFKTAYSKEFCGGPHVSNTQEIGHFRILKEEAVGAGLRRIRATVD